jgi:hypothetical protein
MMQTPNKPLPMVRLINNKLPPKLKPSQQNKLLLNNNKSMPKHKHKLNNKSPLNKLLKPKLKLKLPLKLRPLKPRLPSQLSLLLKLQLLTERCPYNKLDYKPLKCKLKWMKLLLPLTKRELNNRKLSRTKPRVTIQQVNSKV